jgi:hypothetical protein
MWPVRAGAAAMQKSSPATKTARALFESRVDGMVERWAAATSEDPRRSPPPTQDRARAYTYSSRAPTRSWCRTCSAVAHQTTTTARPASLAANSLPTVCSGWSEGEGY